MCKEGPNQLVHDGKKRSLIRNDYSLTKITDFVKESNFNCEENCSSQMKTNLCKVLISHLVEVAKTCYMELIENHNHLVFDDQHLEPAIFARIKDHLDYRSMSFSDFLWHFMPIKPTAIDKESLFDSEGHLRHL